MHSDLIGKIEKARHYAREPERFALDSLTSRFRGGNNDHTLTLHEGSWTCDCVAFHRHQTCAHMMALQKMLAPMLSEQARADVPLTLHSDSISMIEKSRHYVHEPDRVVISELQGRFHGSNNDHTLALNQHWACDCTSFRLYHTCAHVMALQKILHASLPPEALEADGLVGEQKIIDSLT